MLGWLRNAVSLGLLAVLTGGPLATVVCAEWCAPSPQHAQTASHHGDHSVHRLGTVATGASADCHGQGVGAGPRVAAHLSPECLDYTLTDRDAGPVTPRLVVSQPMSSALSLSDAGAAASARGADTGPRFAPASPPRPPTANLILRI